MDQAEIEKKCKEFLMVNYQLDLAVPVIINPRLSSSLGKFVHSAKTNKPLRLEFSKKFMENGKPGDKLKVIKHECIHYALFSQGQPFRDGDRYFEEELVKHDSVSTDIIVFKTERNVRVYVCKCTEHVFMAKVSAKVCTKCRAALEYRGTRKQMV